MQFVLILMLFLAVYCDTILAFGTDGHRIVANLCWYLLPRHIKDEIYGLLDEKKVSYYCKNSIRCPCVFQNEHLPSMPVLGFA